MSEKGFIQLYRSLVEWEWYSDINVTRLFIHCLLKANWKDGNFKGAKIDRGSFVTSLQKLSEETSLSVKQVRVALDKLIRTGEVANKSHTKYRIVTVKNYDLYQQEGKQKDKQRANKGQQYNNSNKEIKEIYNGIVDLPSVNKMTDNRIKHLNARINDYGYDVVKEVFSNIHKSDFLCGRSSDWKCNFDWIVNPNNFVKIVEGKYHQETKPKKSEYVLECERLGIEP